MNRIKEARLKQKLTQQNLSEMSGLSQSYINELENGKKVNPSKAVLEKIATVLRVPLNKLLE